MLLDDMTISLSGIHLSLIWTVIRVELLPDMGADKNDAIFKRKIVYTGRLIGDKLICQQTIT